MSVYDAHEICALFDRGENIMDWIKAREGTQHNSTTAILYSYDVQAGSYTERLEDPAVRALKDRLGQYLATILDELTPNSLLDAGIGEATSLAPILGHLKKRPKHVLGFDISLSRLLFAREHLARDGHSDVSLFTARLDRIPLAPESVDVILTVHALEPNHGQEEPLLTELLRVSRRHLVLVEPSYETASAEARARMDKHGYVRGIAESLKRLGHNPRVERVPHNIGRLNEAALFIVEKPQPTALSVNTPPFVSPISGKPLFERQDCYYCPEDGHAFPVIAGIPCLVVENGVLVSKLSQFGMK